VKATCAVCGPLPEDTPTYTVGTDHASVVHAVDASDDRRPYLEPPDSEPCGPVTCGDQRDLYPMAPGKVTLTCGRRPHKSGKHTQYRADRSVEAQWWGP
jgi:hypothetical protein